MTHAEIIQEIFGDENRIEVNVTQEDIDSGVQGSCHVCPIGRAIARAVPSCKVFVENGYISLFHTPSNAHYVGKQKLGEASKKFVNHFDHPVSKQDSKRFVKPFRFLLFRTNFIVERKR